MSFDFGLVTIWSLILMLIQVRNWCFKPAAVWGWILKDVFIRSRIRVLPQWSDRLILRNVIRLQRFFIIRRDFSFLFKVFQEDFMSGFIVIHSLFFTTSKNSRREYSIKSQILTIMIHHRWWCCRANVRSWIELFPLKLKYEVLFFPISTKSALINSAIDLFAF